MNGIFQPAKDKKRGKLLAEQLHNLSLWVKKIEVTQFVNKTDGLLFFPNSDKIDTDYTLNLVTRDTEPI